MAVNVHQLVGRFIAVDNEQTIASTKDPQKTFKRRQLFMNCSRYDGLTGKQIDENYPLLEFGGKALEQLNQLVASGLKKDDLVEVSFVVDGIKYTKDGKTQVMNKIRPIGIIPYVLPYQQPQQAQAQAPAAPEPAPVPTPAPQQANQPKDDGLPF